MGVFGRLSEPVFLREYQDHSDQIQQLKEIYPTLNEVGKSVLLKDMQLIEYGMIGEENIAFELSHSHLPMYIIHDLCEILLLFVSRVAARSDIYTIFYSIY